MVNYAIKVRIQKAIALLVRTEERIERISETVGYGTGFALSKAFKRIAGVSPQHYRLLYSQPATPLTRLEPPYPKVETTIE